MCNVLKHADHLLREGPLTAQDLMCALPRAEDPPKIRLGHVAFLQGVLNRRDRIRRLSGPTLFFIGVHQRSPHVELVALRCPFWGAPKPFDLTSRLSMILIVVDWLDPHSPLPCSELLSSRGRQKPAAAEALRGCRSVHSGYQILTHGDVQVKRLPSLSEE